MRAASLIEAYLDARRATGRSEAAGVTTRTVLTRFFEHVAESGVRDVREVAPEHVVSFMASLEGGKTVRGGPFSPVTRASWLTLIRVFFAFLVGRGALLLNPASGVELVREERLPRGVLSLSQARRLMAAPFPGNPVGKRDRAILELLYGTGIRLSECARLEMGDIDLLSGQLLVRDGKGKKDRLVPIPGRAALALETYLKDARRELLGDPRETAVFISWRTGERLSSDAIQIVVRRRARAAGIARPVHPHALRHACATHLLKGGADIRQIQELLGHKSLRSTMLYTRVDAADLRRAIERSHPRERSWRSSEKR